LSSSLSIAAGCSLSILPPRKNYPFSWGNPRLVAPSLIHRFLNPPESHPKGYVDRFIRFCKSRLADPILLSPKYDPPKLPFPWGIRAPPNTRFLGLIPVHIPNGTSIGSADSANRGWLLGLTLCRTQRFVLVSSLYASIWTLLAVCIERCVRLNEIKFIMPAPYRGH